MTLRTKYRLAAKSINCLPPTTSEPLTNPTIVFKVLKRSKNQRFMAYYTRDHHYTWDGMLVEPTYMLD